MSKERKQCTKCKHFLLFEDFRVNKKIGQLTRQCFKCLEKAKMHKKRLKCQHERQRSICKECGGSQICPHERQRSHCKECGGSQICPHERQRSRCKECKGSQICQHERIRYKCRDCKGSGICEHKKQRHQCSICDPQGHLAHVVRNRVYHALQGNKEMSSKEYLGCDIQMLRQHIESQFTEGMSWKNYGSEWHIDHKVPLKYQQNGQPPTLEEVAERLHYTNTQPMWASENISKGNRFISE